MIFDELKTGFRWYDALSKQTRFKEYCENMCEYGLISPCNDLLPFQIRVPEFGAPTEWVLNYLDGTFAKTIIVDPSPLTWTVVSGTPNIIYLIADFGVTNIIIGNAIWDTNMDTTMAALVVSVNTNTDSDPTDSTNMKANTGFTTFDNSIGYTASYNATTNEFTLNAPEDIGAGINGQNSLLFSWNGSVIVVSPSTSQGWSSGSSTEIQTNTLDISECIPFLNQYTINGFDYIQYNGIDLMGCLPQQLACGKWYSTISDGTNTLYSEVFEVVQFEDIPFEQMKLPLFTAWRFYDDINKQTRYKEYCESACGFYSLSGNDKLLPFQIKAPATTGVQSWKLVGVDEDCEIILDTSLVTIVNTSDGDRIIYNGGAITNLSCGKYYSVLDDGVTVWYSELIEIIDIQDENNYLQTDDGINLLTDSGEYITVD